MERQKLLRKGEADPYGSPLSIPAPELPDDPKQNLMWEREHLGFYVSDHPLNYVEGSAIAGHIVERQAGQRVTLVGVVMEADPKKTRSGTAWTKFSLEDSSGRCRCFSFGVEREVRNGQIVRAVGEVVLRDDSENEVKVFEIKVLEEW